MSYCFSGFFAKCDEDDGVKLASLMPENVQAKLITEPFFGIGFSDKEEIFRNPDSEMSIQIIDSSVLVTDVAIIYIYYSTWAGSVEFASGYAFRNGQLLTDGNIEGEDHAGNAVFEDLLSHLDTYLQDGIFAPFRRGYWGES